MKLKKLSNLLLCVLLGSSLAGCSSPSSSKGEDKNNTIIVGATQVPGGDLFEYLKPEFEKEGYNLEIKIFNDYITPNTALEEGDLDANLFQHKPFLTETIEKTGYDLIDAVGLYEAPLIAYSDNIKSLDELKSGDKIAISNDPTNGSRALIYLQDENIIKLKDIELPGINDILENPKNLKFIEAEAATLPSLLPDVSVAFINSNFAIASGLDATKNGIYIPILDGTYVNVLACKTEDKDSKKIKVLKKVLTSDKSRDFLNKNFKGAIIPSF